MKKNKCPHFVFLPPLLLAGCRTNRQRVVSRGKQKSCCSIGMSTFSSPESTAIMHACVISSKEFNEFARSMARCTIIHENNKTAAEKLIANRRCSTSNPESQRKRCKKEFIHQKAFIRGVESSRVSSRDAINASQSSNEKPRICNLIFMWLCAAGVFRLFLSVSLRQVRLGKSTGKKTRKNPCKLWYMAMPNGQMERTRARTSVD